MTAIPAHRVPHLAANIRRLNRRADRLGLPSIAADITLPYLASWPVNVDGDVRYIDVETVDVTIVGETPVLDGATLLAAIDWIDGRPVVRLAPDADTDHRPDTPRCEHCGLIRSRKRTAIIHRDGQALQVGTTCLKDFLGHPDPAAAVAFLSDVNTLLDDDEYSDMTGAFLGYRPLDVLARTAAVIRTVGWTSRITAQQYLNRTATADIVSATWGEIDVTDEDIATAEDTLGWVATLDAGDDNYLANLVAVLGPDATYVTARHLGIACSAITARQRAQEQDAAAAAEQEAAPAPTGRVTVTGTVTRAYRQENAYGVRDVWTVRADEGWTVWSTVPAAAFDGHTLNTLVGQRVTFDANLTPAPDRATFAFGKRPGKVTVG